VSHIAGREIPWLLSARRVLPFVISRDWKEAARVAIRAVAKRGGVDQFGNQTREINARDQLARAAGRKPRPDLGRVTMLRIECVDQAIDR
jgi:hypothetical protein